MLNQDAAVRQGVAQGADADARAGPLMAEDPVDAHELPTPHAQRCRHSTSRSY